MDKNCRMVIRMLRGILDGTHEIAQGAKVGNEIQYFKSKSEYSVDEDWCFALFDKEKKCFEFDNEPKLIPCSDMIAVEGLSKDEQEVVLAHFIVIAHNGNEASPRKHPLAVSLYEFITE